MDTALRTSRAGAFAGVFAAGNVVHPVDTADVAALDGAHVAEQVRTWLTRPRDVPPGIRLLADRPFRWIAPSLLRPGDSAPARSRLLLWSDELIRLPHICITQDGREIARHRIPWPASPGRVFRLPFTLLDAVDRCGGDVTIALR